MRKPIPKVIPKTRAIEEKLERIAKALEQIAYYHAPTMAQKQKDGLR